MGQGKRLHLSSERMALLVSGAPAINTSDPDAAITPTLLKRVQNISYGFDYGAQQLREIGSYEYIKDRTPAVGVDGETHPSGKTSRIPIIAQPTVGLQFGYLFFDTLNEKNIGFNVGVPNAEGDAPNELRGIFSSSPLYHEPAFDGETFDAVANKGDVNFFVLAEDSNSRRDIVGKTEIAGVKASGLITFNADGAFGNLVGSTIKIGDSSLSQGSDWNYIDSSGQSNALAASSLASAINSIEGTPFSATVRGATVAVEASSIGDSGNVDIELTGHSTIADLVAVPGALTGGIIYGPLDHRRFRLDDLDLIGFGNCYLESYSISATLGSFVTCSLSYACSNITFDIVGPDVYSPAVDNSGTRSGAKVTLDGAALGAAFEAIPVKYEWSVSREYNVNDRVVYGDETYEALQSSMGQEPSDGSVYWTSDTNASLALSPGDVEVKLINNKPTQHNTKGFHSVDLNADDASIQSIEINVPIERKDINSFGSNYMRDRKMQFPILATLDLSFITRDYEKKGQIANIFNDDIDYDVVITFYNRTSLSKKIERATIKVHNAKLNAESHTAAIGGFATVDASFLFEATPSPDQCGLEILQPYTE